MRLKSRAGPVAICGGLRNPASMARGARTADFSKEDRRRLGDAVIAARLAAGHRWRPSFCAATGVKKRSLEAIEAGSVGVGATVLAEVGAALGRFHENWNADTPVAILRGASAPSLKAPLAAVGPPATDDAAIEIISNPQKVGSDEWLDAIAQLLDGEDLKVALKVGLEVRQRRRHFEDEVRQQVELVLQRRAERDRPDRTSSEKSRVD